MRDVLSELDKWTVRGDRVALATVVDVQRSAPRAPGAKMAVNEHGEIAGSVSGGCVEGAVAEIADQVLRGSEPRLLHFGIADSDAWDAVDVRSSRCALAGAWGWDPYVVDRRARFATAERFPDATEVIAAWPEEAVARLGGIDPATSIIVLTHDPKLDDAALIVALRSD